MNKTLISKYMTFSTALIAVLVTFASLLGLFTSSPYVLETENWRLQAQGQDIGNLIGVVVLVTSILLARKGSFRAYLVWLGTLFYLLYAYIIYAVAVHFNSLFLIYVSVLGLTLFTLIFVLAREQATFEASKVKAVKLASYTLIAIGVLFGLLWLSEIIPALISGDVPRSTQDAGLWVNPVYVIDLSTVVPGLLITGYLALKNKRTGKLFLAPWLVFSALMGSSIVAAMLLMLTKGYASIIPPMVMVSAVVLASTVAAAKYLKTVTVK